MKISSILLFVCIAFLSSISAENEFGTRSISLGGAYTALSDDWEGL
jgi:type II secretory pathway component PulJ